MSLIRALPGRTRGTGLLLLAALAACTPSGGAGDAGVLEACGDGGPPACFSNADCPADQRCTTPTNADPTIPITCCLPGSRGTGDAGEACTGLDDCASAICAYTPSGPLCSQSCDAGCPPSLPVCVTVDTADAGVSDGGLAQFCGLPP